MKDIFTLLKKTKSFLLVFMLLWAAMDLSAQTTVSDELGLKNAIASAPTTLTTIILGSDISLTSPIALNGAKKILIQSDATHRTITWAGAPNSATTPANFRHFTLTAANTTLTLENITLDGDNKGGGIEFITGAAATTTLTINNSVIKNCYTTSHGGAIYVNFASPVILNNSTFSGNRAGYDSDAGDWVATAANGGAVSTISTLSLTNTVFVNNNAGATGGAINLTTGVLTLVGDVVFDSNTAGTTGGAINKTTGAITATALTSLTITNNTANENGGGIAGTATIAATNGSLKITNNTAKTGNGGGIYTTAALSLLREKVDTISGNIAGGSGGAIFANTTLTLGNLSFSDNRAGYNSDADTIVPAGNGGAIHAGAGLTLQDTLIFTRNSAGGNGGAINKAATAYTLTNLKRLKLTDNAAITGSGGAINTAIALTLNGTNTDTISGNSAGAAGGAIHAGTLAVTLNNLVFANNRAGTTGGAINQTTGTLTLEGTVVFDSNTAGTDGGAINKTSGAITVTNLTSLKMLNNTAITGNGGGIITTSAFTLPATSSDTISNNTAGGNGGAFFVGNNCTVANTYFSDNRAGYNRDANIVVPGGNGGAIAITFSGTANANLLTIQTNTTFVNNRASQHGGAISTPATTGTMNASANRLFLEGNVIFLNNTADVNGGAIYKAHTSVFTTDNLTSLILKNNKTITGNGGGIYTTAALALIYAKLDTVSGNIAGGNGGAIFANTTLSLGNFYFSNNRAGYNSNADTIVPAGHGGAIHAGAGLTLRDTLTFTKNSAGGNGGAINKAASTAYTLTNLSLKLTDNEAITGNGGAINTAAALNLTTVVNTDTISGNSAGDAGGAIYAGTLAVTLPDFVFANNSAGTAGGAVATTTGAISLANTVFANNSAGTTGGAINLTTGGLTLLGNVVFDSNTAGTTGGAINKTTGAITATGLTSLNITNNTANENGGGIAGTVSIPATNLTSSFKITNNTAKTGNGGGIYSTAAIVISHAKFDTISGNIAGGSGGAIFANTTLTLGNLCFSNNRAGYDSDANTILPTGHGGAIHAGAGLTLHDTLIFTKNSAGGNGGAINKAATAYTVTNLKRLKLTGNAAITGNGGAIHTGVALTALTNANTDTVSGNTAGGNGGAIFSNVGNLTFNGLYFLNNKAGYDGVADTVVPGGNGGAIAVAQVTTANGNLLSLLGDMTFDGNTASQDGGAISIPSPPTPATPNTLTLAGNLLFLNNTATRNGGAINRTGPNAFTVSTDKLKITNNTAKTGNGGAIYTEAPLILSNAITDTISGNIAGESGGAIFTNTALTLGNSYFSDNKAGYNSNTDTWLSTANGGAITATDALTLQNATEFTNNTAGGNGGAIYKPTGIFTMSASATVPLSLIVNNNTTIYGDGGGIYTAVALNIPAANANLTFTNNTAGRDGGAIFTTDNDLYTTLRILPPALSAIFSGNTASTWNMTAGRDIITHNAIFNNRNNFTFSDDNHGSPSQYGLNNYDVNYPPTLLVTFEPNNGGPVFDQWVRVGSTLDLSLLPQIVPTKPGFGFYGWYPNAALTGEPWALGTPITQDTTLYAKWGTEYNSFRTVNCRQTDTINVLAWNTVPCSLADITVTILEGSKTGASVNMVNNNIEYTIPANFTGWDTLKYSVMCDDPDTAYTKYLCVLVTKCPENLGTATCFMDPSFTNTGIRQLYQSPAGDVVTTGSTVVVGDIDNCGEVEILALNTISNSATNHQHNAIYVYAVDKTADTLYRKYTISVPVSESSFIRSFNPISIAKIEGETYSSIFFASIFEGVLYKYDFDGTTWGPSPNWSLGGVKYTINPAYYPVSPTIADLMGSGRTQIAVLDKIIDAKSGTILVDAGFIPHPDSPSPISSYSFGRFGVLETAYPQCYESSLVAMDVDGDGIMELIGGDCVYAVNLTDFDHAVPANTYTLKMRALKGTRTDIGDGGTALADFDNCGLPEVVVTGPVENNYAATNGTIYIYNPRTGALLHENSITNVPKPVNSGLSRPVVGNFGRAGFPVEIAVAGTNTLQVYYLNFATLPTPTLTQRTAVAFATSNPFGSTTPTVFDFVHDKKARLVYRDRTTMRIIDVSGSASTAVSFANTHNLSQNEYPVVADVNGDEAAEIIVAAGSVAGDHRGRLCVFASGLQPWAPARAVWNQMSYYALNVNDDLTIPQHPMSTGTLFPGKDGLLGTTDDLRPFNGFLMQQTTLDEDGNKLWRSPNIVWHTPLTATIAGDSVVFKGCLENLGDAPLVAPIFVSYYKKMPGSSFLVDTLYYTFPAGSTYCFSKTLPNIGHYAPMDSVWFSLNDRNGVYPYQMQCGTIDGRRGYSISLKKTNQGFLEIVDCVEPHITIDVLADDTITSCSRGEVAINVFSPTLAGNSAKIVGDNILFTYRDGFSGRDTVNYTINCKDTMYGGMVFVRVVPCPDNIKTAHCTVEGGISDWDIQLLLTESTTVSARSVPLAGDIDGDGDIEILVPGNLDATDTYANNMRIFKVNSRYIPTEKFILQQTFTLQQNLAIPYINVTNNPYSIANVDNGQYAAIFVATVYSNPPTSTANDRGRLIKYTTTNGTTYTRAWVGASAPQYSTNTAWESPQPIIVNFNGGNMAHAMVYGKIYNTTGAAGTLLLDLGLFNTTGKGITATSTVATADLDDDGFPEVIAGNWVYKVNITNNTAATGNSFTSYRANTVVGRTEITDGSTAVADMTGDGFLDAIVTSTPTAGTSALYIWSPRTREILNDNVVTFAGNISTPAVGDIFSGGSPEIAFTTTDTLRVFAYDAATKLLTQKWARKVNNPSGTTAVTLFDFDQDGRNELVYRDADFLMIIDSNGFDKIAPVPCGSAAGREYPVIADVDRDGSADIIVTGGVTNDPVGQVMIFASKPDRIKWAPARKVWNQYAYNAVNINENLTVPPIQINPASFFPKQNNNFYPKIKQPYNGCLMQQTLLDHNGEPLWPLPHIVWATGPVVGFLENRVAFNGCIKNDGLAGLQAPIYLSFYKNNPNILTNKIAEDSINTYIVPNTSYCIFSMTLDNLDAHAPIESLWISVNDSAGIYPYQPQCLDSRWEVKLSADNITAGIPECYDSLTVDVRPYMAARNCASSSNVTTGASLLGATITTTDSTFTYYWATIEKDTLDYSVSCNGITLYGKIFITPILCPAIPDDIIIEIDSACYGETVTLTASAPTINNPVFRWYNSQKGNAPLCVGNTYTTPELMTSVQLYVSVSGDGISENTPGNRKLVNVILKPTPFVIMKSDCEDE